MDDKQKEYERGQQDYNDTKDSLGGATKSTPFASVFESNEEYEERLDAYKKGFDNAEKNDG